MLFIFDQLTKIRYANISYNHGGKTMLIISANQLQNDFDKYFDVVTQGEEILITINNIKVAKLFYASISPIFPLLSQSFFLVPTNTILL